jgi:hypothetical protein
MSKAVNSFFVPSSTGANIWHIEAVKYLINKTYSNLINIKNSAHYCLTLDNFFGRSTDHKQRVD